MVHTKAAQGVTPAQSAGTDTHPGSGTPARGTSRGSPATPGGGGESARSGWCRWGLFSGVSAGEPWWLGRVVVPHAVGVLVGRLLGLAGWRAVQCSRCVEGGCLVPELVGSGVGFDRVVLTRKRRAAAARSANQGAGAGTARRHGWKRTPADEELLDFAGRFGAVTLRHATQHFYGGVWETARKRVQYMAEAGLLDRNDNLKWAGTLIYPTAAGMSAVRALGHPELRAIAPSDERMLHRLLVAEAALRMHARSVPVISERQMRAVERAEDGGRAAEAFALLSGVAVDGSGESGGPIVRPTVDGVGRVRWWGIPAGTKGEVHWPDFMAIVGGRMVAVEVEIAMKERWRMLSVLRGYKMAIEGGHIAQVLWQVTPDVLVQLQGRRGSNGWEDGLLQELGYLESGRVPDWSVKGRPMVVRAIEGSDEGVRYALSQRVLVPSIRSSYRQWKVWRSIWMEESPSLDFEDWLMRPTTMARLRSMT